MPLFNALREQILILSKTTEQDAEGGMREVVQEETQKRWASIVALPAFQEGQLGAKRLKARSPSGPMSQERYEIILREQPPLPTIHMILWNQKKLVPQSHPQPHKERGFVSFQACVYQSETIQENQMQGGD